LIYLGRRSCKCRQEENCQLIDLHDTNISQKIEIIIEHFCLLKDAHLRASAKNNSFSDFKFTYDKATLVPTNVYRNTFDEVASDFLIHYGCAQYLTTPMPVLIFDIARKCVGLTVRTSQQLSVNCDVLGTIAFFDGMLKSMTPEHKVISPMRSNVVRC
jgi:hypothetical protein